jgi:hypothetical protein
MNKLLQKQAILLSQTFNDFGTFDFNREIAEKMMTKYGKEIEQAGSFPKFLAINENLVSLFNESSELLPLIPLFERDGTKLVLKSVRFFEINRYAIAISAFIKGVDQFVSVEKILESKQYQFIVFAYYSSIFQFLTSFLALHGIVYISKSSEGTSLEVVKTEKESEITKQIVNFTPIGFEKFIKGKYNDSNSQWDFANISNDHTTRWKEFCDLLKLYLRNNWESQVPRGIERFWGYMKVQGEYKQKRWDKDKKFYQVAFKDKNEFISTLSQYSFYPSKIRHQKIYEDRHYDLFAWAYLTHNETLPDDMKTPEQEFFRECAKDILLWQYRNLKEVFDLVQSICANKESFYKGMNAIADTPDIRILEYLKEPLMKDIILYKLNKNLSEFINLLFA